MLLFFFVFAFCFLDRTNDSLAYLFTRINNVYSKTLEIFNFKTFEVVNLEKLTLYCYWRVVQNEGTLILLLYKAQICSLFCAVVHIFATGISSNRAILYTCAVLTRRCAVLNVKMCRHQFERFRLQMPVHDYGSYMVFTSIPCKLFL